MKNRLIIAGLLASSVALLGVLAYLLAFDGGGSGSTRLAGKAASPRRGAADVGLRDAAFRSAANTDEEVAALTPEQEARVRAALEKLGNETAVRAAFFAGVAEPWPLPAAQERFKRCVTRVQRGLPKEGGFDAGVICACAVRAMQQAYPRSPPEPTTGNYRRVVGESFRTAVDECMYP